MRMSRRAFLTAAALPAAPTRVRREVFLRSPGKGTAVLAHASYTRARGVEMISVEQRMSRSDTMDIAFYRRSADNGRTWSEPEARPTREARPDGTLRRHFRPGWVDPVTGRYLEFWVEGILPNDDPLEGLRQWNLFYRISEDGGRTWSGAEQVIHEGSEYTARHPLPGVYTGKNCVMLGDLSCQPLAAGDGGILVPVEITPLAPDGSLYNPTGGYTYTDAAVLIGRWQGRRLRWRMSEPIPGDPGRSTRGMVEPTLGRLDDGRLIAIMRGSNDTRPDLPSYKWISYSSDGGKRWTKPAPWTYSTGEPFYSPSACSQLLHHSSGRLLWLGNITPANPRGNRPRYPFFVGEVDRRSGLLIRHSLTLVDDRAPGESELLTLSNFFAREDRETHEVALHLTRLFAFPDGWVGDALLYRIRI
jgi:hypothetical protein